MPHSAPTHKPPGYLSKQERERLRGSSRERGYTRRWEKARLIFLGRDPLCAGCKAEGRVEAAAVVDHIIPHKGNQELFWDMENWQGLCRPCHSRKTAAGDGGFGNTEKRR